MQNEVQTVASVDLTRYVGDWFEIARLPLKWEDDKAQDITATYSFSDDGSVIVDNRCINADGKPIQAVGKATPSDSTNAKLSVTFLPVGLRWLPFTKGDYWILKVDPAYTVALVGTPDRTHLWLLSRTPVVGDEIKQQYLAHAIEQGFSLDQLIEPVQTGAKVDDPSFKSG